MAALVFFGRFPSDAGAVSAVVGGAVVDYEWNGEAGAARVVVHATAGAEADVRAAMTSAGYTEAS